MTLAEIMANALFTLSILLALRNSVHTWWIGIIASSLFVVIFAEAKLYADVTLQVFFIATCLIGWQRWSGAVVPAAAISHARPTQIAVLAGAGLGAAAIYSLILGTYTDAAAPLPDSLVLVASVIGQLLLVQRKIETWAFWFIADAIAVPLYLSRGLTITAAVYAVYWVNAAIAFFYWRRLMLAVSTQA